MKLLTAAIKKSLPKIMATDGVPLADKKIQVKFFTPDSNWTWYVFEGEEKENGDYEFFGMVHGFEKEMGTFYLSDLESIRGQMGLPIERDRHIGTPTYSEVA